MNFKPKKDIYTEQGFIELMKNLLKGHENDSSFIDPECQKKKENKKYVRKVFGGKIKIDNKEIGFKIHGDTRYKAVKEFLNLIENSGKLDIVLGPVSGIKFGVSGGYIENFQVHLTSAAQIKEYKSQLGSKKGKPAKPNNTKAKPKTKENQKSKNKPNPAAKTKEQAPTKKGTVIPKKSENNSPLSEFIKIIKEKAPLDKMMDYFKRNKAS